MLSYLLHIALYWNIFYQFNFDIMSHDEKVFKKGTIMTAKSSKAAKSRFTSSCSSMSGLPLPSSCAAFSTRHTTSLFASNFSQCSPLASLNFVSFVEHISCLSNSHFLIRS